MTIRRARALAFAGLVALAIAAGGSGEPKRAVVHTGAASAPAAPGGAIRHRAASRPPARGDATPARAVAVTVQVRPRDSGILLPAALGFQIVSANPTTGPATLRFDLPAASDRVVITIQDITGQRVATPVYGPFGPGSYRAQWDGKDDRGRALRPGVYFVRFRTGQSEAVRRLVLRP